MSSKLPAISTWCGARAASFSVALLDKLRERSRTGLLESSCVLQELRAIEARMPQISADLGARYLNSLTILQTLTHTSETLVQESEALLKLAVGQSEANSVISGTTALLDSSFQYLDLWRSEVQNRSGDLATCIEVFSHVLAIKSSIEKLVAPLTYIQTMFRIESARLPEEARQVSAGLIEQISSVHQEVTKSFSEQFQIVATALDTLNDVRSRVGRQSGEIGTTLALRREQIDLAFTRLKEELCKNAERDISLSATSREISSAISGIVVALQTHDIAGQRLEAICSAISDTRALVAQVPSRDSDLQRAWFLLTLQTAQLESVHQQLEEAEAALDASIEAITRKVTYLDRDCLMLREFEEVTIASNGSVELSLEMITDAQAFMESAVSSSRDFHAYMKPVDQLTTKLSGALEHLAVAMHLIAMNAQVQGVHIGEGTGLEVLAANTARISNETTTLAHDISTGIVSVVQAVQNLTQMFLETIARGEQTLTRLQSESAPYEASLHELRNTSLTKLRDVGTLTDEIRRLTLTLADESSGRRLAIASTAEAVGVLGSLAERLRKRIGVVDPAAFLMSGNYRMKAERDVHTRVLKSLGVAVEELCPEIPEAETAGDEAAEADCIVELF